VDIRGERGEGRKREKRRRKEGGSYYPFSPKWMLRRKREKEKKKKKKRTETEKRFWATSLYGV